MEDHKTNVDNLPSIDLVKYLFILNQSSTSSEEATQIREKSMAIIEKENMTNFYLHFCSKTQTQPNPTILNTMQERNKLALEELDEKIKDAEENLGENELREALLNKANFYLHICDKENSLSAFRVTMEKTVALGQKLDIVFSIIHLALILGDADLLARNIDKAKVLYDEGGDWERKNRLKVYEGISFLFRRNFKAASEKFLETVTTFSCNELFDYPTFVAYTMICSVLFLDRVDLKKKIIESPEIRSVSNEFPALDLMVNSLYHCNYRDFFFGLDQVCQYYFSDWLVGPHMVYFCREMRIIGYNQLLQSYCSVQLPLMADAFGISQEYLDKELSRFISLGRIHCKIDKVQGIIITKRPNAKNALYLATIKEGDSLLNRIQHLSRVVEL